DSSCAAAIGLIRRQLAQSGKELVLESLRDQHRATLALTPEATAVRGEPEPVGGALERFGDRVLGLAHGFGAFADLVADAARQIAALVARRVRLPPGAVCHQIETMGIDAIFIVGLLSFLTGMTMAYQGAVQLQRFGADVFVADLVGMSMVRELVPLMT